MQEPDVRYAVELKVVEPKLEAERRFIDAERRYVQQQLENSAGQSWSTWRPVKVGALGVYRRQDWEKYERALAKYGHELDRYEEEMEDGLVPFKVFVTNMGQEADTGVKVKVTVENGTIHEGRQAPERPGRLDANAHVPSPKRPAWVGPGGFVRRAVRIGRHGLAAEFSRLAPGESAEVVRQTLHVAADDDTRLLYEIHSRQVPEADGEVEVLLD